MTEISGQTLVSKSGFARPTTRRVLAMLSLVLAGEAIYGLPFHVVRYFRPTYVEVFDVSQQQLGVLGAIYGVVAMGSYVLGGGLADRFAARGLLVFSLLITGASGFYLAAIPSFSGLCLLFGFWGVSTILPFWSALIKATRDWGGSSEQGIAFGLLDGGRGLFAAVLAMLALFSFAQLLSEGGAAATRVEKITALQSTIYVYVGACGIAALSVWLFLPAVPPAEAVGNTPASPSGHLMTVLKMPTVWLQAAIIIAAYCTFKGIDYFSQYARDVWLWSDTQAAGLSAFGSWMRPVAALGAGLLADRCGTSRVVVSCFVITGSAYLSFLAIPSAATWAWWLWASVLTSSLGLFALRGIYFALLEESQIPREKTGTAVGVVSFVGYSPEIFMPLLGGWLIDRWSGGPVGYHVLFFCLSAISGLGVAATWALRRLERQTG